MKPHARRLTAAVALFALAATCWTGAGAASATTDVVPAVVEASAAASPEPMYPYHRGVDFTVRAPGDEDSGPLQSGPAPHVVEFVADHPESPVESRWEFGDGNTAGGYGPEILKVVHTYETPGKYTATLTQTQDNGYTETRSKVVIVTGEYMQASIAYDGHVPYENTAKAKSNTVKVTKFDDGEIKSVVGSATLPGRDGGDAVVTFDITPTFGTGWLTGSITVDDPGAGLYIEKLVTKSSGTPFGEDGAQGELEWVEWEGWTPNTYTLAWSVGTVVQEAEEIAPNARFDTTVWQGLVPEPVTFDSSPSQDPTPDSKIIAQEWDFGDGTTAGGPQVAKTFDKGGRYPVTLTVYSTSGLSSSITHIIDIAPLTLSAPVIQSVKDYGNNINVALSWDWLPQADGYEIERGFIAGCIGGGTRPVTWVGSNGYTDSANAMSSPSFCWGSRYKWRVRAVHNDVRGAWSDWVERTL